MTHRRRKQRGLAARAAITTAAVPLGVAGMFGPGPAVAAGAVPSRKALPA
ncbi:hypothetical protein [Streptomyces sp. Wb2n-11]|nr:hypothetical protein [Streptomyces sp. Wb2n-11]